MSIKKKQKVYDLKFCIPSSLLHNIFDPTNGIRAWKGVRRDEYTICFGSSNRDLWSLHVHVGVQLDVTGAGS